MKKYNKLAVTLAALLVLTTGSVASAQTSTSTTATTTDTTITTPGTPNTGTGGNAAINWLLLGASGLVFLGGVSYLGRKPQHSAK